jgi:alpha-aminoadipate carrier protein LysW
LKEEFEMAGTVACVVCEGIVKLPENCGLGEILVCGDCGTELEVVGLDPIRAEEAPQVQEDWGE